MNYSHFVLLVQSRRDDGVYPVVVADSPARPDAPPATDVRLPPRLESRNLVERLSRHCLGRAAREFHAIPPPGDLALRARSAGHDLFQSLFTGAIRSCFEESLARLSGDPDRGLRIELQADARDVTLAPLLHLPWELLHDPNQPDPLCLDPRTPLVRRIAPVIQRERGFPELPLHVLAIAPNPDPARRLDLERELVEMRHSLAGVAEIHVLRRPTREALHDALHERSVHVLHFMGHGAFSPQLGRSWLLLEDHSGNQRPISADSFARLLRQAPDLVLVVLNACESGISPAAVLFDPFAGTGAALVARGIPAVVAMQFSISDVAAIQFCKALYTALAQGQPIEQAVTEGRMLLADTPHLSWEWTTPVLYLQTPSLCLPRIDPEEGPGRRMRRPVPRKLDSPIDFLPLLRAKTAESLPRTAALERMREFAAERRSGTIVLRGIPGCGRSSLLADLVQQSGCVHHFEVRAEGVSGPDLRIRGLAGQLVRRHSLPLSYLERAREGSAGELSRILARVSASIEGQEWVVVDLEDAEIAQHPDSEIAQRLGFPRELPEGLIVCIGTDRTAASTGDGPDLLSLAVDALPDQLEGLEQRLGTLAERSSIRAYLNRWGSSRSCRRSLAERSERSFLYLDLLGHDLGEALADVPLGELPVGLVGYLHWKWQRIRNRQDLDWQHETLPVLLAVLPPHAPATLEGIVSVSGLADRGRIRRALSSLAPLVTRHSLTRTSMGQTGYAIVHEAVLDFLYARELDPAERDAFSVARLEVERRLWKRTRESSRS
ncbi:MAG TPA: CHAT domain-containing protein [Gemmatimonadales bacterium]|nr:CHAT domain-containing protein [Gemmatimonadales bacterium]